MERRKFIKIGITTLFIPIIIKIENLIKIATPKEISIAENEDISFNEFQQQILKVIARDLEIPESLLMKEFKTDQKRKNKLFHFST